MQCGSITGAAQTLHISQPSVSRLIGDLERAVGFALFSRVGRRLVATVEAQRFLQAVDGAFMGIDRLHELATTIRTTAGGVTTLGVIPAFSHIVMPEAVRDFYRARPDTRCMIHIRNTPAIVDAVRMQQFDIGVVGRAPPYAGVEVLFHTQVPYLCLLPEGHPAAAGRARLDLHKLAETEHFVTFGGTYPDEMLAIDHQLSSRLQQHSRLSAANMPVAASLVRETGALAILDPYTASVARRLGGVVSRPLKQRLNYHIAVVTRGLDTLSLAARELAGLLIARFGESVD